MSHVERHTGSSDIQWGKVVAGAAVATGTIMLGVAVANGNIPLLSDVTQGVTQIAKSLFEGLGNSVSALFTPAASAPEGSSVFQALGDLFSNVGQAVRDNSTSIAGSTLLAGGLGYFTMHYADPQTQVQPALAEVNARVRNAQMGFAARHEMSVANAIMNAQMQAFGQGGRGM